MRFGKLQELLKEEPDYRQKQAHQAIFEQLVESWDEATTLAKPLREKLDQDFPLKSLASITEAKNKQTQKALLLLEDGEKIETVLMRHQDRNTVCVSSQVGCPLGCKFCATGKMGFTRNLTDWEIVQQVLVFARQLKKENQKVTNLVYMGMGEPLLNYDEVISSIRILNEKMGLGARRFSVSTAGIPEGIKRLVQEKLDINLALSLHAPNDKLRSELMPINRQFPLSEVMEAVDEHLKKKYRKVMFEYLMISGVNDDIKQAQELVKLVGKRRVIINLIPYNPTGSFEPSSHNRIRKFKEVLEEAGLNVTQRFEFGQEIKAACGQLATKNEKKQS